MDSVGGTANKVSSFVIDCWVLETPRVILEIYQKSAGT